MHPGTAAEAKTTGDSDVVTANYNKLSDHIRRLTPQGIQCSVFCGGANCKYENPDNWTADSLAIQGLYSHWITDQVLAMARPSTVLIIQKNIIQQFQSLGIKSIINLQCPKEHASCGQPLEESGFSYDPNVFMENNIFYYNFAWKDYGDATVIGLLNMVKVVAFAVKEGRVAIHCHAGLGRTGVLIACYLVFSLRVQANAAIRYVRTRRPGSVQTRGQIFCVRHFAQYILPNLVTFYIKDVNRDRNMIEFTLDRFLKRQKIALHGYEERHYKHIPKIVHKICERILRVCNRWTNDFPESSSIPLTSDFFCAKMGSSMARHESIYSICSNLDEMNLLSPTSAHSPSSSSSDVISVGSAPPSPNPSDSSDGAALDTLSEIDDEISENIVESRCFEESEMQKNFDEIKESGSLERVVETAVVVEILANADVNSLKIEEKLRMRQFQEQVNSSQIGWKRLDMLADVHLLGALLVDWLENLKKPVLNSSNLEIIVIHYKSAESCLGKLAQNCAYLLEYLLIFVSKLHTGSDELQNNLIKRFLAALTQQYITLGDKAVPSGRGYRKLRDGTTACVMTFLQDLLRIVEDHNRNNSVSRVSDFVADQTKSDDESDVEDAFQPIQH